jgi:hypothetical protein
VYPIGVPALFLVLLVKNRKNLRDAQTQAWLGFLYEAYTPNNCEFCRSRSSFMHGSLFLSSRVQGGSSSWTAARACS